MDLKRAFDFTERVVIVTGGSGVLCSALAEALGAQGARVVVVGHSHIERAEAVARRIGARGGEATAAQADVLDAASLTELAELVMASYGRLDILVNGAGGARPDATTSPQLSFFDLPEEAVRWVFDLNFMGTFLPCQILGRIMAAQGRGVILNIGSMAALRPLTRSVAYSAAKSAVVNFTQWLAVHMSQEYSTAIRVNALIPGFFLTEQNRFLLYDADTGALTERGGRIMDHTPMGRLGQPEDLIGPALFLLSDAACFVHGTALVIDGGISAYGGI
ncbi:MAG: SDR family oxidoreductase [Anaerolineae bacterium]|nr:SDR family oxidoreductase [Anaerolineae bacterium]